MHRVAMWMSYKNQPSRNLHFPYQAKSPTLKKIITYDEDELWNEIWRIVDDAQGGKFTLGAALYHSLVFCADSTYFLTPETIFALEEYIAIKRFNLALASTIDEADYHRLVIYSAIDEEFNALQSEDMKKKNG
tara:strand:- start:6066 stop:6464 length:399 start_codon:yes stop_codon:yes gene_type:complete